MIDVAQELMTPHEAARWFRRSPSWLRQQKNLLRLRSRCGQPLFHVRVCRAYVLAQLCQADEAALRRVQIEALAAACGLAPSRARDLLAPGDDASAAQPRGAEENRCGDYSPT